MYYFYIIQEIKSKKYYAGSKIARNSDPNNFWKENGYKTSSNTVKNIIERDGLDSFRIRKLKIFDTPEEAYEYETKFLKKVNAAQNCNFLNKHNNNKITPGTREFYEIMIQKYGVDNAMKSEKLHKEWINKFKLKYGVDNPSKLQKVKEKKRKTAIKNGYDPKDNFKRITKEKYGVDNASTLDWVKEKKKQKSLEKFGVDNVWKAPEIKEKIKQTNLKKFGVDCVLKSSEIKEKIKQTNLKKYGAENYAKTEEFKESNKNRLKKHHSRPIINEIKEYQKKYNIKFGRGWTNRSTENLEKLKQEIIEKYEN